MNYTGKQILSVIGAQLSGSADFEQIFNDLPIGILATDTQ